MQKNKSTNQQYLLHEEKVIEINTAITKDNEQRARIMRDITIAFFGFRRYKYVTLQCSLNNFRTSLHIANILHNRIQKLAMIIKFKENSYWKCQTGTDNMEQHKQSLFLTRLTLYPTEADKKQPGFNPGLENIQKPLKTIFKKYYNQKAKITKQSNKKIDKTKQSYKKKDNQKKESPIKQPKQKKYRREKSYDARSKLPQHQRSQRQTRYDARSKSPQYQKKARDQTKTTGNVAVHDYKKEHLNRDVQNNKGQDEKLYRPNSKMNENRGSREPRANRYE